MLVVVVKPCLASINHAGEHLTQIMAEVGVAISASCPDGLVSVGSAFFFLLALVFLITPASFHSVFFSAPQNQALILGGLNL